MPLETRAEEACESLHRDELHMPPSARTRLNALPAGALATAWDAATRELHACVLATCALMGAASLLPLGCPSSHLQEMYTTAVQMVQQPLAGGDAARCEERRLGCLMFACLACNLPLPMLQVLVVATRRCL
jgi:hypothetical protein